MVSRTNHIAQTTEEAVHVHQEGGCIRDVSLSHDFRQLLDHPQVDEHVSFGAGAQKGVSTIHQSHFEVYTPHIYIHKSQVVGVLGSRLGTSEPTNGIANCAHSGFASVQPTSHVLKYLNDRGEWVNI